MMMKFSFAGDLVALFDEDDIDEVKQERNEVDKLSSVFMWLPNTCTYFV